jgi:hypothetical protein
MIQPKVITFKKRKPLRNLTNLKKQEIKNEKPLRNLKKSKVENLTDSKKEIENPFVSQESIKKDFLKRRSKYKEFKKLNQNSSPLGKYQNDDEFLSFNGQFCNMK